jgi:hypothetical protein
VDSWICRTRWRRPLLLLGAGFVGAVCGSLLKSRGILLPTAVGLGGAIAYGLWIGAIRCKSWDNLTGEERANAFFAVWLAVGLLAGFVVSICVL